MEERECRSAVIEETRERKAERKSDTRPKGARAGVKVGGCFQGTAQDGV